MSYRVAKALTTLIDQINEAYPKRDKLWDGTIASLNHHKQNPTSDHEAKNFSDGNGPIVTACDITHDPENGVNSYSLADALLATHDPRIKYIISNGRIAGDEGYAKRNGATAWVWKKYKGSSPHDHHVHISVNGIASKYDSTKLWDLSGYVGKVKEVVKPNLPSANDQSDNRLKAAHLIVNYEARRDKLGRLKVYPLPKGDGGGTYEVAGINDRYHPQEAKELADLIRAGKFEDAENKAVEVIAEYTDVAGRWVSSPGISFFLRDCVFNRGHRGAAIILQRAVGVKTDGIIGSDTLNATSALEPIKLLVKLRSAREWYERNYVHRDESSKFWKGLVNRWNNAVADAKTFNG